MATKNLTNHAALDALQFFTSFTKNGGHGDNPPWKNLPGCSRQQYMDALANAEKGLTQLHEHDIDLKVAVIQAVVAAADK